jgi:hypothetical protein
MSNTPDCTLPVDSPRLIQEGDEIPGPISVLQVQVALEIICDMVRVASWEGCTNRAHHFLAGI